MTKVVAVNGSPEMEKGNTAVVLGAFLDGMKEAGADVELLYAKRLEVKDCVADFDCWWKVPGECIIQDNMQLIYPKLREADILVLATPVYAPLPGVMQHFLNRLCPLMEPSLEWHDERTRAKFHKNVKIRKIVLVSTSGWWEIGNFGTVLRIAEELAKNVGQELAGAVLRPHAFIMHENIKKVDEVLKATKKAGFQIVKEGRISKDCLDTISQPLVPEEELRQRYNDQYKEAKNRNTI